MLRKYMWRAVNGAEEDNKFIYIVTVWAIKA